MPVTFRKELVTDTWLIPRIRGRSLRNLRSPKLQRRPRQIVMSGDGAVAAWRILTNPENNSDLHDLLRNDRGAEINLQYVLESTLEDWNPGDDVGQGLRDLQAHYNEDSTIPSDDDVSQALNLLYTVRRFQDRFIHELLSPTGNSQASTQASSGESTSSHILTSNSFGSASGHLSMPDDSAPGDDDQVHLDQDEEGEEEKEEERPRRNRVPTRLYEPENWNSNKRRRRR